MFEVTEKFNSAYNLRRHYIKHVKNVKSGQIPFGDVSLKEYEEVADITQRMPVDNIRIFGYEVERDGKRAYNKFDKDTNIFVAYYYENNVPLTINCYKMSFDKFMRRSINKIGDIPEGK